MTSLHKLVYGITPWNLAHLTESKRKPSALLRMLSEAIIDDLIAKYPHLEQVLLQAKIDIDPKYQRWFAKTYDKFASGEDIDTELYQELVKEISLFKKLSDQKKIKGQDSDIEKYKSPEDLKNIVTQASETKSNSEKSKDEVDYLLRDNRFIVASPRTHAASCKLGSNTPWCVSTPSNDSYWEDYTRQYEIHFVMVIDKQPISPEYAKVAIAVSERSGNVEIYDADDERIEVYDIRQAWGDRFEEIWELITGSKYNVQGPKLVETSLEQLNQQIVDEGQLYFENLKFSEQSLTDIANSEDVYGTISIPRINDSSFKNCTFGKSSKVNINTSTFVLCSFHDVSRDDFAVKNSRIQNSSLISADLEKFGGSKLTSVTIAKCTTSEDMVHNLQELDDCVVSSCNLGAVQITNNQKIEKTLIQNTRFGMLWLSNGTFEDTQFKNCTFDDIQFDATVFKNCEFKNCSFVVNFGSEYPQATFAQHLEKIFIDGTEIPAELRAYIA